MSAAPVPSVRPGRNRGFQPGGSERVRGAGYGARPMRLIVARCSVEYSGRLSARLPEALRLVMLKADGSVLVHADAGGYKPLNWMTPPTVVEESDGLIVVRKLKGDDRLEIRLAEVLSDVDHAMDEDAHRLEKDGVERHLQELLADTPECCGEGFRLVRREWPTDIGPVDLMCRDEEDGWIAVEIKRVGTIDAVEQLTRYLQRIRLDPALADCRGVLAAQVIKPLARVLAEARGMAWVEVDLDELRGLREPALTLFG
jgi:RecB family endonuclease NucS